jgi:hypothetical protein
LTKQIGQSITLVHSILQTKNWTLYEKVELKLSNIC